MLSFFKVRVIVNKHEIYPLPNEKTVVIPLADDHPRIVATDGLHFTRPLELRYDGPGYYTFNVSCAIDDMELLAGGFLLILFYLAGFFTNIFLLKLLSFAPVLYFLLRYYGNRKEFLRFTPAKP